MDPTGDDRSSSCGQEHGTLIPATWKLGEQAPPFQSSNVDARVAISRHDALDRICGNCTCAYAAFKVFPNPMRYLGCVVSCFSKSARCAFQKAASWLGAFACGWALGVANCAHAGPCPIRWRR